MKLMRVIPVAALLAMSPALAWAGQRGGHPTPAAHPQSPGQANKPTPHTPVTVPQQVAANPALATRLQPLLPPGMTLAEAATGFKNQGQFIAALHVSHNLDIPFTQLKTDMTGPNHLSLGQSIQQLKPGVNANTSVKTAEKEADLDVKASRTKTKNADDQ
jgi:hypothetical protein